MTKENTNDFDFEKWSGLANEDPEAFEQTRERVINQFIADLPEDKQQRMRCLQWRVDSVRRLSKTPMAACIEISKMMWDSIKGEHGLIVAIKDLQSICQFDGEYQAVQQTEANILNFPIEQTSKAFTSSQDLL